MFVKKNLLLFPTNSEFYSNDMSLITRQANEIRLPFHRTTFFEKGPYYAAIKAYRSLPVLIRDIAHIKKFRASVINYLEDKCYYSFNCW